MRDKITWLKQQAEQELSKILDYWALYAVDNKNGGFVGRIDEDNIVDEQAAKGSVLNARILWSFSAAYNYNKNAAHLALATRAYEYFAAHFVDEGNGGVYWTVSHIGEPLETKKQIYACAFAIYALSEYYIASRHQPAKDLATRIFQSIVQHAHDPAHGGFYEAFSIEWKELKDQRLSEKDANEKKTTNTNLHVLEAFANLYRICPDGRLRSLSIELLEIFAEKIIDPASGHLRLFFDDEWNNRPDVISYGHDIEAAWLLLDCAKVIGDERMIEVFTAKSISLTNAAMEGLDKDGGLWYEYELHTNEMIYQKHWWVQAEAVVGFLNSYQLSANEMYLDAAIKCWQFIESSMINPLGEWYWGLNKDGAVMVGQDIVGLWKCPYHNSRACLRLIS